MTFSDGKLQTKTHFPGAAAAADFPCRPMDGRAVPMLPWRPRGSPASAVPIRASPALRGAACRHTASCLLWPLGYGNTKRMGRSVTNRQPPFQLIFDELIDNKTKKGVFFEGGWWWFAFVDVGGGSFWAREG